jgi:hypothetical protein
VHELSADVVVVGGGLGGVSAALAALRGGRTVLLTNGDGWLGGQLTAQAVPPDEHPWSERFGITASYRHLRDEIREYYRRWYPLTDAARRAPYLNPGAGWVSPLCHEPRVAVAVLEAMLAPYRSAGTLRLLEPYAPISVAVDGDEIRAVTLRNTRDGTEIVVSGRLFLDATETGDVLPLAGVEYVVGFESQHDTGEPSAPPKAQPENMQAVSWCFAVDCVDGNNVIDKPDEYDFWRRYEPAFWPDRLLSFTYPNPRTLDPTTATFTPNPDDDPLTVVADQSQNPGSADLWTFRRIAARRMFTPGAYLSDITIVNWPQIDYLEGPIVDVEPATAERHLQGARELSRCVLYWLQTEAPRADGGVGHPGLRLRPDVTGSPDGFAQEPYIREGRRIKAVTTVVEQDLSLAVRGERGAVSYPDSVGIGMYRIDLHPSTAGDNYIDVGACPFQIPLGALLPERMRNLLPAAKNIGTTHITNGCYRLHPVEWNIGEAAGSLAAFCLENNVPPHGVRDDPTLLADYQQALRRRGVELEWPVIRGY